MSVFFLSEPPDDPQLAELWTLLAREQFPPAMELAEAVCQNQNAPIEYFCGLSLAYGESGYYAEAEQVARTAIGFGEGHWRARHALAVALMHQGRFLGALDSLGFHRSPTEIYVVRAQIETMGGYLDSLRVTLDDALDLRDAPPAIRLYLAYLYAALGEGPDQAGARAQIVQLGEYVDVWARDADRHRHSPYGEQVALHVAGIRRIVRGGR